MTTVPVIVGADGGPTDGGSGFEKLIKCQAGSLGHGPYEIVGVFSRHRQRRRVSVGP